MFDKKGDEMKCSRLWAVEAIRDGRLVGQEASDMLRHIRGCPDCVAEQEQFELLGKSLRELPQPQLDELSVRRNKQQLLAKVNKRALSSSDQFLGLSWGKLAVVAVVVSVVFTGAKMLHHQTTVALVSPANSSGLVSSIQSSSSDSSYGQNIHAQSNNLEKNGSPLPLPSWVSVTTVGQGVLWSQSVVSDSVEVSLQEGVLRLQISKESPRQRVVVKVPDGEIEDLGTTFSVTVKDGKTTQLVVDQGAIVFKRPGQTLIALAEGQTWPSSEVKKTNGADSRVSANSAGPLSQGPGISNTSAGAVYDKKAEDALYLRIVQHSKQGDMTKAKQLADEYLFRFPNGFRRREVESVLR